jgi:hypothetical protein
MIGGDGAKYLRTLDIRQYYRLARAKHFSGCRRCHLARRKRSRHCHHKRRGDSAAKIRHHHELPAVG